MHFEVLPFLTVLGMDSAWQYNAPKAAKIEKDLVNFNLTNAHSDLRPASIPSAYITHLPMYNGGLWPGLKTEI